MPAARRRMPKRSRRFARLGLSVHLVDLVDLKLKGGELPGLIPVEAEFEKFLIELGPCRAHPPEHDVHPQRTPRVAPGNQGKSALRDLQVVGRIRPADVYVAKLVVQSIVDAGMRIGRDEKFCALANRAAHRCGAAPSLARPGLMGALSNVVAGARRVAYDILELLAREARRAGLTLVWMIALGLATAFLGVTAWIGLMAA